MNISPFELHHPSGLNVSHVLTEQETLSVIPEMIESKQDMGTGWVWYRMPAFTDGDVVVGISLGFNHGILEQMSIADINTQYGANWSEWSEEKEIHRAKSIAAWLYKHGFPTGQYPWGDIWCGYDAKGGFGSATVHYGPNK
jgi:hypothetical protein